MYLKTHKTKIQFKKNGIVLEFLKYKPYRNSFNKNKK
jgi:hypothetical protein